METLILARHGESEYSARGLVNGDPSVGVGLTEAGQGEARRLGALIAGDAVELCVVTRLRRTRLTAELALAGRAVTFEEWGDLDDPGYGSFEGQRLDDYRAWAWEAGSADEPGGGGESRHAIVTRYARAYRALLARPEGTILAVLHALPIAYVLGALDGLAPAARVGRAVEYATPYRVAAAELEAAVAVLEAWCAAPTW